MLPVNMARGPSETLARVSYSLTGKYAQLRSPSSISFSGNSDWSRRHADNWKLLNVLRKNTRTVVKRCTLLLFSWFFFYSFFILYFYALSLLRRNVKIWKAYVHLYVQIYISRTDLVAPSFVGSATICCYSCLDPACRYICIASCKWQCFELSRPTCVRRSVCRHYFSRAYLSRVNVNFLT